MGALISIIASLFLVLCKYHVHTYLSVGDLLLCTIPHICVQAIDLIPFLRLFSFCLPLDRDRARELSSFNLPLHGFFVFFIVIQLMCGEHWTPVS